jgi:hypothetical protein
LQRTIGSRATAGGEIACGEMVTGDECRHPAKSSAFVDAD